MSSGNSVSEMHQVEVWGRLHSWASFRSVSVPDAVTVGTERRVLLLFHLLRPVGFLE